MDHREQARLQELYTYNVLDTLQEKEYDQITKLASLICDAPMSLVSLVDKDRQWFKSRHGVQDQETSRAVSFCSHAIQTPGQPFIVKDARLDERFKDNPMVTGHPHVVFYAGIPLVSSGFGLGTVCVIDTRPRELTQEQIDGLKILSDMVMNLLQHTRINRELDKTRDTLLMQNAILNRNAADLERQLDAQATRRLIEIADQNKVLERVNKELEAFAYVSSHDLQEPLRKIQTFASMLEEREAENLSEKGSEYLRKIGYSAQLMSALIRDLLAYSRSSSEDQDFGRTRLRDIVDDVLIDLEIEIKSKNAVVDVCEDCEFAVIVFQFRQLIYNLLTNSLKFARQDVAPHIELSCREIDGDGVSDWPVDASKQYYRITVKDNGIGFDPDYNQRIFELFQRLGSRKVDTGTGIGLAIVRKIVDNHKGYIFADGVQDGGATFEIFIPRKD